MGGCFIGCVAQWAIVMVLVLPPFQCVPNSALAGEVFHEPSLLSQRESAKRLVLGVPMDGGHFVGRYVVPLRLFGLVPD